MRAIPPIQIGPAQLTSSSCAEPAVGEVVYNSGVSYAVGAQVISTTAHRSYKSLTAGNLGHPLPVYPETENAYWLDVGPTSRWAMFDLDRSGKTTSSSPLVVTVTPGMRANSIGLFGLEADEVVIEVKIAGETVYSDTTRLKSREVVDWYSFFFEPFSINPTVLRHNLPPYTSAAITVTATREVGAVSIGAMVIGNDVYIGKTQHSAESEKLNFSKIDRDEEGNSVLNRRRTVPRTNQNVRCSKANVNRVRALQEELNAVPAVWSGLDDQESGYFESLLILGIYKRFTINLDMAEEALITLELEEI